MVATVFIVDDDPAMRSGLVHLFQSVGYPTHPCSSAQEFLRTFPGESCGCIILDVRMPAMSGLELQSELRTRGINLPVIMMTGYADVAVAIRALKGGAFDFIEKPFSDQYLLELVAKAIAVDQRRQGLRTACTEFEGRLTRLTAREREILEHLVAGKANKVIAVECELSLRTVEAHREHIMRKIGLNGLADLVRTVTAVRLARAEDEARKGDSTAYATALRAELSQLLPKTSEEGAALPQSDPQDR